jgi:catechol 2,3-dioxygenase-like lactoylglutathione lyase family enzyme
MVIRCSVDEVERCVFRQVVVHRWADGTTDDDRHGFRAAMEALRAIPELSALRYGDDAARFEGNHEFVAVLDFPDFAAARRYVEAEPHRRFVAEHARRVVEARVVVQHDWAEGVPSGLHHLKLPVTDVPRSRDWYKRALGFLDEVEFHEDGALRGVGLRHVEGDLQLALRADPERARALAGFDSVCLAVGTRADLDVLLSRLDTMGIPHTEPVPGHRGWAADVPDPDGLVVRIHTLI